jgi:ribonuclease P protein component
MVVKKQFEDEEQVREQVLLLPSFMIARSYRLNAGKPLYNYTLHKTPLFTLKYARNEQIYSRVGFIISKKVSKKATVRNRAKRVFRTCIEKDFARITPGYDILFILQRHILEKDQEILCPLIKDVLVKQKLL